MKKSGLRFYYYRCTHKNRKRGCESTTFVRQEKFAEEIIRNVRLATLPDEWKERFLAKLEIYETDDAVAKKAQIGALRADFRAVQAKIDRLNDGFTDGSIDLAEFKEMKNPLVARKVELDGKIASLERAKASRVEPVRNWISEVNSLGKAVAEENFGEMTTFLKKVGLNRVFRDQTLTVSFLKPWAALAETNLAVAADNVVAVTNESQ